MATDRDPTTGAAIANTRQPAAPGRDVVRQVYPVGNTVGPLAGGTTDRAPATVGTAGGAIPVPANQPSPATDLPQRLGIAGKLVQTGGSATSADSNAVAQHLASIMSLSQLQKLRSTGVHVIVVHDSVTDYRADLKGVQPRGLPQGTTWDTGSGTLTRNNQPIVATHTGPHGERELPGPMQSSSADVVVHEIGHAINRRDGRLFQWASDSSDFRSAYDQDAVKGPLASAYYHQPNSSAGRDEAFAESHAEFFRNPNAMKTQYPNLFAYWQRYYGGNK